MSTSRMAAIAGGTGMALGIGATALGVWFVRGLTELFDDSEYDD